MVLLREGEKWGGRGKKKSTNEFYEKKVEVEAKKGREKKKGGKERGEKGCEKRREIERG